ncbi:vacuolar protein-sorting protein bro1 [Moniliophthora roreri]|nr:vacuolar protein-sorting protein bro1 [Moniliophthora roreri]
MDAEVEMCDLGKTSVRQPGYYIARPPTTRRSDRLPGTILYYIGPRRALKIGEQKHPANPGARANSVRVTFNLLLRMRGYMNV